MIECLIAVIVLLYIAGAILMSCFIKFSGAEPGGLEIPFLACDCVYRFLRRYGRANQASH